MLTGGCKWFLRRPSSSLSHVVSRALVSSSGKGSEGLPSATASENTTADRTSSHTPSNVQMTPSGDLDKTHRHVHHTQPHTSLVMERMRRNMGGHSGGPLALLGVESSCDDTGVGVVDERGCVLGEAVHSQLLEHQKTGGIIPGRASELHHHNLQRVTNLALERSGRSLREIGGIAVTVGPGLKSCLWEGVKFAKKLAKEANKPLLPIHHMEAHALIARMDKIIPFPHLVLLCSGGHCLLAIALGVTKYALLGRCLDASPGDAFDKCARRMRLNLHPDLHGLSGGAAMEKMALRGNSSRVQLIKDNTPIMQSRLCCNFSFSGITETVNVFCNKLAQKGWDEEHPPPCTEDLCAAFQEAVFDHLTMRTNRAILYCEKRGMKIRHLVASGGVASNQLLRSRLDSLTKFFGVQLHVPPPPHCTDNGVMIAWAGMERLKALEAGQYEPWVQEDWMKGTGVYWDEKEQCQIEPMPRLPLGKDYSKSVEDSKIKVKRDYAKVKKSRKAYYRQRFRPKLTFDPNKS